MKKFLNKKVACGLILFFAIFMFLDLYLLPTPMISVDVQLTQKDSIQFFEDTWYGYNSKQCHTVQIENTNRSKCKVNISSNTRNIRIDFGHYPGKIFIYSIALHYTDWFVIKSWDTSNNFAGWKPLQHIKNWEVQEKCLFVESIGNDPSIDYHIPWTIRVLYRFCHCCISLFLFVLVWILIKYVHASFINMDEIKRKATLFIMMSLVILIIFFELLSLVIVKVRYNRIVFEINSEQNLAEILFHKQVVHPYLGYAYTNGNYGFLTHNKNSRLKRSSDKFIIGIVGGSVATIFANLGPDVLRQELQKSSKFKGREIIVINLASGGYKQPQQIMAFNLFMALGVEVDMLINIDGFNEVALYPVENFDSGVPLVFPRSWHLIGTPYSGLTFLKLKSRYLELKEKQQNLHNTYRRSWFRYSNSFDLLCHLYNDYLANSITVTRTQLQEHQKTVEIPFGDYDHVSDERMYLELVDIWQRCSVQLSKICHATNAEYFHFLQPNQYVKNSKPMREKERSIAYCPSMPYKVGVEKGYPLLRKRGKLLKKIEISFSDLTMIFQDYEELIYTDGCCHFNQLGNDIMARAIAEVILEKKKGESLGER